MSVASEGNVAPSSRSWLAECPEPLAQRFDVALLDLDGVVYVGDAAVPGVAAALDRARRAGMRLAFVTNNAARPPETVADRLYRLGIAAHADEVITSAQTAAHYLAERLPSGAAVLVVGTDGLTEALRERGLRPVFSADDAPQAVVQGYSPTLTWSALAEGAVAIGRGVPWVATNLDATVPSARGPLPGNGSLVAALRHATGVTPVATGKPEPTMHRETVERTGAQAPLVVGDRLDTDIEGAHAVGCPSLLVLSGVTAAARLLTAGPKHRPTFVGWDAGALLDDHPAPVVDAGGARCGSWHARTDAGVGGTGAVLATDRGESGAAEALDALRAMAALAWSRGTEETPLAWRAADDAARSVLARFGLPPSDSRTNG
jgi:HAD superfamily hydrolase (TIGR01450 family)